MTNALIKQERVRLAYRYNRARYNLLIAIIFTVINIVLLVTKSDSYFLFSATVPYFIADLGMLYAGMYPEEVYFELGFEPFLDSTGFAFVISIAVVVLLVYLLCFIFSKNNKSGWLIAALVFFALDTLALILLYGFDLFDVLFHAWVIYDIACGIKAHGDLKKLPELAPEEETDTATALTDSEPLYTADMSVKHRVLLQTEALGREVIYRRVNKTNELVIDGKVYVSVEMLAEPAHSLSARIDGHEIKVGYNGIFASYAELDGEVIAKKTRLI